MEEYPMIEEWKEHMSKLGMTEKVIVYMSYIDDAGFDVRTGIMSLVLVDTEEEAKKIVEILNSKDVSEILDAMEIPGRRIYSHIFDYYSIPQAKFPITDEKEFKKFMTDKISRVLND